MQIGIQKQNMFLSKTEHKNPVCNAIKTQKGIQNIIILNEEPWTCERIQKDIVKFKKIWL